MSMCAATHRARHGSRGADGRLNTRAAADQAWLARNALARVRNDNKPNTSTRHPLTGGSR
jgi:hypothetical protein